ncbi:MAG: NAD(P)-dependent alcohol dehydrogenase [Chloroflexi bacterium]|nr:NAD(P)-dependent alcohol dehydrogenase [Chloroflexota bacterium]
MKAIVWTHYGSPDGLQLQEVAKPTIKDNEILIKVYASTVTAGDCEMRRLKFPFWLSLPMRAWIGFRRPRKSILGQELAGEVAEVGSGVTRFKPGDAVFGTGGFGHGAYAEYVSLPENPDTGVLAIKPAGVSYEEAATVAVGGLEALRFLRNANIQPGESVLINGAGGSIGTYGIQLAKYFGAEVTGVDSSAKLDMLSALNADHVIDYTREDFAKGGQRYDVIFDVVGKVFCAKHPFAQASRSLSDGDPRLSSMLRGKWTERTGKLIIAGTEPLTAEDLSFLAHLIEVGTLKPVIDRRYPLAQTAEAHRYVETGQKKGNLIIHVANTATTL